ncbi:transglutaminase superfamily protein [Micromonospora endolithica]|nr:transglutaminase superfamily protein [Micromonospora endolithica]
MTAPERGRPGAAALAGRILAATPLPVALAALVALAGVVLDRVYAGALLTVLVLGSAVGSVAVSVAARRLPSWVVAPLSVLALAGWTVFALRWSANSAGVPGPLAGSVADAAANGIPRLLTALIPVEPAPDTVLVPVVAAWLAGLAGAEVALRARRVLLGYLPPVLLYAGALYVVGPNADPAARPTLAFVAVAVLGLLTPGGAGPPAGLPAPVRAAVRLRLVTASAAGVAVVVGLSALLGPALAGQVGGRPVDPRRYVEPPRVDAWDENPLVRISGWALNPEQPLLDVRTPVGADPRGDRIRLAVLSDYDGVTWRVGATYRNAGRVLPAPAPPESATTGTVRQEITVAELRGRLLPAVATPREVTGARVAYDPATGTLIRPEGLAPGLRYTVTSVRERPDANLLATASVPAGEEVARVLRVPDGVPDPVRRLAAELAESNGAPYARAAAVEQFLAEHYRLVADSPSGHAYPNLAFFLFGPRAGGGQRGTSEQFAASFAVLGRLTGLPTRVVVGFRSTGDGPVRAGDAYAWPEVLFDGLGWVPFDPLPRPDDEPRPVEEDFRPPPEEPPPSQVPEPTVEPTAPPEPVAASDGEAGGGGVGTPVLVAVGTGGVLLLVGALLFVLAALRRSLTRARLQRGDPGQRIAGAWREVTDALRLAGHRVGTDLSATEVAVRAHRVLADARARHAGTDPGTVTDGPGGGFVANPGGAVGTGDAGSAGGPGASSGAGPAGGIGAGVAGGGIGAGVAGGTGVEELADLLNRLVFAPGTSSEGEAARAVTLARDYTAALRAARPRWRRLLWSVHPGPLRRDRGTGPVERPASTDGRDPTPHDHARSML